MKKSLYNIEQEYLEITNQLEDGEATPELETALAINENELQGKAVAYAYVMKERAANILAIKAEKKRLDALEKSEQSIIDKLKQTIHQAMDLYGINEIKTETLKLNFRRSEGVVSNNDIITKPIDDELCTYTPEQWKPNLTAIKAAIKEGREVEGYDLEERFNLQIK
mgnify:FL=1